MSEFVFLFRSTESEHMEHMGTPERAQQNMEAWLGWVRRLESAGHLKNPGQPLEPTGKVVRGRQTILDGPFVETKELVLGFMIIEARDIDEAVALSRECPVLGGAGSVEVRPIATF
jgi:hypothetical protein